MPPDHRRRLHYDESAAPLKQPRQHGQADSAGGIQPSRPHTSLQEQCQLAAEEKILGLDRLRRSEKEQHPPEDVFD
jgi:hypothetical protein